jgi:hypothetical protein
MTNIRKGIITSFYYGSEEAADDPCAVEMNDAKIAVTYYDPYAERDVTYKGNAKGPGHYEVTRDDGEGKGTFHCFEDSEYIEGYWSECGEGGMWAIKLKSG